ncbi:MAG TPA: SGNH/GDSL hydrolase family protein [Mucilaginibacter sp.]|nr:SGNH/GDSL hydrolase family protein [Mucilaginibacter sp.]
MRLLCSIILTIAAFAGCTKTRTDTPTIKPMAATPDSLSYLALGDSYTVGEAVPKDESFPHQLRTALSSQGYKVSTPTVIATTGWTTDNLIDAIGSSGLKGRHYDFVTLLIGVNDQYQGLSLDNYRVRFQQVLNTALDFTGGDKTTVFVLSIPDYGVTPFAQGRDAEIGPQIDQFNAINKLISAAAGVNYLDITPISRQAANDPGLIAPDGLHPSGKMYDLWVEQLMPVVKSMVHSP